MSDEFYFGSDRTIHMRVTCPLVPRDMKWGKCCPDDGDNFLICSLSNLHITRTGIKSQTN